MRTDVVGWVRAQWDRAAAWACVLAGVITLFFGWLGVSETVLTAKQMPYIAGCGLGGMFMLGTGAMLWLSADLRDEWRKLDRIERAIIEHGTAGIDAAGAERDRPRAAAEHTVHDDGPPTPEAVSRARAAAGRLR